MFSPGTDLCSLRAVRQCKGWRTTIIWNRTQQELIIQAPRLEVLDFKSHLHRNAGEREDTLKSSFCFSSSQSESISSTFQGGRSA